MESFKFTSRETWGAMQPTSFKPRKFPIRYVFCISTLSTQCNDDRKCERALRLLQSYQMKEKDYHDLRYNFLIGGNGVVYEGRGWVNEPLLPVKYGRFSKGSLLLGFMGLFKEETLPSRMVNARDAFIQFGIKNGYIAQGFRPYQLFNDQSTYVETHL